MGSRNAGIRERGANERVELREGPPAQGFRQKRNESPERVSRSPSLWRRSGSAFGNGTPNPTLRGQSWRTPGSCFRKDSAQLRSFATRRRSERRRRSQLRLSAPGVGRKPHGTAVSSFRRRVLNIL